MSYRAPLSDMAYLLSDVIDWQEVFSLPQFAECDPTLATEVLKEAARFTEGVLAPLNPIGDLHGSHLDESGVTTAPGFPHAWSEFATGGWGGLDLPSDCGGQNLPLTLQVATAEMVNSANVAFGMLATSTRCASWLLHEHAEPVLRQRVVPKLVSGEWTATICISEAQAGSDVGRILTRAVPDAENTYRLNGTKIFISYGDHDITEQICHMVLARTPDAEAGTRGLSLFIVPKLDFDSGGDNGCQVIRVEKKMGLKASPTCVLEFDNAKAYRVGAEGRGLACMFTMVNLMRLDVSVQGVAIAEAASMAAIRYAQERLQAGDRPRRRYRSPNMSTSGGN